MKLLSILGVVLGAAALSVAGYLLLSTSAGTFVRFNQTATRQNNTTTLTNTTNTTSPTRTVARKALAGPTDAGILLGSPVTLQLKTKDGKVAIALQVRAQYYVSESGAKTLIAGFVQNAQGEAAALAALTTALSATNLPDKDSEAAIDTFENSVREQINSSYDLKNFESQLALFLLASANVLGAPVTVTPAEQYSFVIAPNFTGSITDKSQQAAVTKFVYGVIGRISAPSTR
jgi:hypothetical protein